MRGGVFKKEKMGGGGILEEKSFLKRNLQIIQKGTLGRLKIYSGGIYFKRKRRGGFLKRRKKIP